MATVATLLVVAVSVGLFLRLSPVGADGSRLRRFNARALVYLATLCVFAALTLSWRASSLEAAVLVAEVFLLVFVPLYLTFAGLFRSRALSSYHRGGKATV